MWSGFMRCVCRALALAGGLLICLQLTACGSSGSPSGGFGLAPCSPTVADSTQNSDGSANRINSATEGNSSYNTYTLPRQKTNGDSITIDYMLHEPTTTPRGLLVLIAGGQLDAGIVGTGSMVTGAGGNFLVRSAHLFAARGYRVLTMDRPSDFADSVLGSTAGSAYDAYRVSAEHAADLSSLINEVNSVDNLRVVIAGTSRGAISAVAQHSLAAAITLSSPVTSGSSGFPVTTTDAAAVTVPAQVIWHKNDACSSTPPAASAALVNAFSDAAGEGLDGGFNDTQINDPCGGSSAHGFLGIETCAVDTTTDWLDGVLAVLPATRPLANEVLSSTPMNTQKILDLNGSGSASAAGALTYSLPFLSSSLGGTLSITGTQVTYDPPSGVFNTDDVFVYRVSEAGGGSSHQLVVVSLTP